MNAPMLKQALIPMTGQEYLDSLNDDREVWIYGRTRQEDDRASGLPQLGPHGRALLRRPARSGPARRADLADGVGRLHAQVLPGAPDGGGAGGLARRDRRVAAHLLRLDGPLARLQGQLPGHPGRQLGLLQGLRGQRAGLVPQGAGAHLVHQPRDHESAGGPQQVQRRHLRRVHPRGQGNRCRPVHQRRQGGGHGLGPDQLHLRRPRRPDPDQGPGLRARCSSFPPARPA